MLHGSVVESASTRLLPDEQLARGSTWSARLIRPRRGPWLQFWSIEGFEFNQLELELANLPEALEGVRLLYLTDLHLRSRWPRGLDPLLQRVKANPPDLILYGGDQAHNMHHLQPSLPHIERLVKELPSRCGSFAILGNHDGDLMGPKLTEWGVHVIVHERIDVPVDGAAIELIGFPGPARRDFDEHFVQQLPSKRDAVPRIVLSHFPDLIRRTASLRPDLYLAGHTHGGQICLPGGIPILRHDSLPRRYCRGVHAYNDTCLLVSRGMGFSSALQARAFCPCEAIEIVLKRDE